MDDDDILSDWVIALKQRQERLAMNLLDLVYGDGAWEDSEQELKDNYIADAWDIMLANPHLLDMEMRVNLTYLGLIKED